MVTTASAALQPKPKLCAIVGVGHGGLGEALARKWTREGYRCLLLGRSLHKLQRVEALITRAMQAQPAQFAGGGAMSTAPQCIQMDAGDEASVKRAFAPYYYYGGDGDDDNEDDRDEKKQRRRISVLIYNCGARRMRKIPVHKVSTDEFVSFWRTNCLGAFLCCKRVLPGMLATNQQQGGGGGGGGGGTILLTGATASLRGSAGLASFATGKFGLRALSQCLARSYSQHNIHVAHIVIDAAIDMPLVRHAIAKHLKLKRDEDVPAQLMAQPAELANVYWSVHAQHKSTWTQELDVRPYTATLVSKM
jgi:NAD(P)-dependent dehydrogenase (short-subunit alcohol dehydrogenase family)